MNNTISLYIEEIIQGISNSQNANKLEVNLSSVINSILTKLADALNLPSINELKNINWSDIKSVFATIGIALVIVFFSLVIMYIFKSIALYKIMKNKGHKNAWLSFVPYGCLYTIGKSVGKTKLYGIEIENSEFLLPAILISNMLPFMCGLSTILFVMAFFGLLYRLYQDRSPSFAVVFIILSILLPILIPFFLFAIRNK